MYDTASVVGLRFLRLPFTQYSPAPVLALRRIATFGFCAKSGMANANNTSSPPIGRKIDFMGLPPFERSLRVKLWQASFTTFRGQEQGPLADDASDWTGSAGVQPPLHSPGKIGQTSGFNCELHRLSHLCRIA